MIMTTPPLTPSAKSWLCLAGMRFRVYSLFQLFARLILISVKHHVKQLMSNRKVSWHTRVVLMFWAFTVVIRPISQLLRESLKPQLWPDYAVLTQEHFSQAAKQSHFLTQKWQESDCGARVTPPVYIVSCLILTTVREPIIAQHGSSCSDVAVWFILFIQATNFFSLHWARGFCVESTQSLDLNWSEEQQKIWSGVGRCQ